jgi:hypothetical protein
VRPRSGALTVTYRKDTAAFRKPATELIEFQLRPPTVPMASNLLPRGIERLFVRAEHAPWSDTLFQRHRPACRPPTGHRESPVRG